MGEGKLTPKQEVFCAEVAMGKNQSDAYREAFNVKKMTKKSLAEKASVLARMVKIRSKIAELRKPVVEKARMTLESHLEDLLELRILAASRNQFAAAITAEIARGKAAGVSNLGDMDSYVAPVSVTIQVKSAKRNG